MEEQGSAGRPMEGGHGRHEHFPRVTGTGCQGSEIQEKPRAFEVHHGTARGRLPGLGASWTAFLKTVSDLNTELQTGEVRHRNGQQGRS